MYDQSAKLVIFISGGLQVIIAILGLFSALTKSVLITRVYSILWWCLTIAVLGLSIVSIVFVARNDKDAILDECRKDIKPADGIAVTDSEANSCYKISVIISAVVLGIQFVIMCLIGWVNERFLKEVKQDAAVAAALKAVDDGEV
ncbi:hypothetical protein BGZ99_006700 [Dissophora globulifera]|uniref:Uncharacterized protein n=1 Tax=Dissophora globulifera TaxID=979702 RepID=A0A9P6UQS9_9FUNG|nr:hypothetical protein BGZ99_006700 [Dissophora globulifera]